MNKKSKSESGRKPDHKRDAGQEESAMNLKKRIAGILQALDEEYGTHLPCALQHKSAWELLVATILSAQCTDARVNMITPGLFKKYPDVKAFSIARPEELEQDIYQAGFYRNKARNIIGCARDLVNKYDGRVPDTLEELIALPGVGRKTANVVLGHFYNKPSIVVDTHVKRISALLGLTDTLDPVKAEFELMKILPMDHWILWNTDIIQLGRNVCIANRPRCQECTLKDYCPSCRKMPCLS